MTDRDTRATELVFYLLWDWYDGGVLEGWGVLSPCEFPVFRRRSAPRATSTSEKGDSARVTRDPDGGHMATSRHRSGHDRIVGSGGTVVALGR